MTDPQKGKPGPKPQVRVRPTSLLRWAPNGLYDSIGYRGRTPFVAITLDSQTGTWTISTMLPIPRTQRVSGNTGFRTQDTARAAAERFVLAWLEVTGLKVDPAAYVLVDRTVGA